jgi:hypothetical protein
MRRIDQAALSAKTDKKTLLLVRQYAESRGYTVSSYVLHLVKEDMKKVGYDL